MCIRDRLNIIHGYGDKAGEALCKHIDVPVISFTGGTKTGKKIASVTAPLFKKLSLELGGKNPIIVFDDADPDFAASLAIKGMNLSRQGQSCSSTSRVLVNKKVKEKFLKSLVEKAKNIPVGLPWIEANEIGPIVSKKQFEGVMSYIKSGVEQGAKLLLGGDQNKSDDLKNGFFVNATIFCDVKPDMKIAKEEIFGPVISVIDWDDYDEMVKIANSTQYGLTTMIVTNSLSKAMKTAEDAEVGYVWVNTAGRYSGAPYGGWKLSGIGVEECFDEMKGYALSLIHI